MWPVSRPDNPKHFIKLIGDKSLFQLNVEAMRGKFEWKDIFVQTTENLVGLVKEQAPEIPEVNIFTEPEMRNQGPATSLAAANLYKISPDEPFMLIQVDDLREPLDKLYLMMETCSRLAIETDKYITGGIKPPFAMMGVDYLIKGERVTAEGEVGVYKVAQFLWRSTKEAVEEFVANGQALVHTNHTCMTPRKFLEMLKRYKPEWYEPLMAYVGGADLRDQYAIMPKGPIEDVTKEVHKNGESLVVELPFVWTDFGTWESVAKYQQDKGQYAAPKNLIEIESSNNFVQTPEGKTVALIGVNDIVVIDTGESLLVCPKSQSGKVGEVPKKLEEIKG
jgi:mannose-1-phosphate guanylyltransferase